MAEEAGYFLRRPDGSTYVGKLWGHYHPPVAVIDVTNPDACAWWGARLTERIRQGATIFKTDFGEAIPIEVVAHNGLSGERLHNAYSLIYNDVVTSVMRDAGIDRPVVWGRSTWAGGQRHVAQWAGDSNSTWQDLASTLRAGLSMALSGHAFWSHDIGGFHGRPSTELYVRWAQFGLLSPLSRFHGTTTRLPWDYGPRRWRPSVPWSSSATPSTPTSMPPRTSPYGAPSPSCGLWSTITPKTPTPRPRTSSTSSVRTYLWPLLPPRGGTFGLVPPRGVGALQRRLVGARTGFRNVTLPLEHAPLWLRAGSAIPLDDPRPPDG